ncbi:hypothetical protein [Streptomyces prasinus]|uniref:hypothetical protein n=1 Tax=Streptomyces prasinus TaxID=67345 RepID=UPI0036994019
MIIELLEELETVIKRFKIAPDQAADLETAPEAEEVTITWQKVTDQPPTVLVTAPTGKDCWAMPIPHRPDWLLSLIMKKAPKWWLK